MREGGSEAAARSGVLGGAALCSMYVCVCARARERECVCERESGDRQRGQSRARNRESETETEIEIGTEAETETESGDHVGWMNVDLYIVSASAGIETRTKG